jgi:hypothetical protein
LGLAICYSLEYLPDLRNILFPLHAFFGEQCSLHTYRNLVARFLVTELDVNFSEGLRHNHKALWDLNQGEGCAMSLLAILELCSLAKIKLGKFAQPA